MNINVCSNNPLVLNLS